MKIGCAWYQSGMGTKPPYEDLSETHGICGPCRKKHFPQGRRGVFAIYSQIDGITTCAFDRRSAL